eukprot:122502-Rhodomonas_salina.1
MLKTLSLLLPDARRLTSPVNTQHSPAANAQHSTLDIPVLVDARRRSSILNTPPLLLLDT